MDSDIIDAIKNRRKIKFVYKSENSDAPQIRIVKPLIYGIHKGFEKIFGMQESPSEHFASFTIGKIGILNVLEERFIPTSKEEADPKDWDNIFASVTPRRMVPRYSPEEELELLSKSHKEINTRLKTETKDSNEPTIADLMNELKTLNNAIADIAAMLRIRWGA